MYRPTRRQVLASAGVFTVAGCFTGRETTGESPSERADDPDDYSFPRRGTVPDRCPEYDGVDRVVAFDDVDPEDVAIFIEPSTDSIDLEERVTFTARNRTETPFVHSTDEWSVHKRVDGRWHRIAPDVLSTPDDRLEGGDEREWTLAVDNDAVEDGRSLEGDDGRDPLRGVGGGEYAFGHRGYFEDDLYEGRVALCAPFELDAEPVPLTPTDAVAETAWEGDTLVVRTDRGDPEDEWTTLGAYELEFVDGDEGIPLITETVLRNDHRRDALAVALEHDADRVRLEEYDGSKPIFGAGQEGTFTYDGRTFDVTTRELE
ncbi:hypothetical protein ACFQGT_10745 [Natrialbaceae archaeon GCM10025810]|uniref:hypothetical protein n=1 Tax=Halovalidus salilacus TaxID=3075124 RepID=UPI00361ACC54